MSGGSPPRRNPPARTARRCVRPVRPGLARPRRLKGWAFAFGFWCERHRRLLFGPGQHGTGVLGDEAAARRGAKLLKDWTMGQNDRAIPVDAAVSLLLSPCRKSSPPAPWELARLSEAERKGRGGRCVYAALSTSGPWHHRAGIQHGRADLRSTRAEDHLRAQGCAACGAVRRRDRTCPAPERSGGLPGPDPR